MRSLRRTALVAAFGLIAVAPLGAAAAPPSSRPDPAAITVDTHRGTPTAALPPGGPPEDW
jgi:hypothetical protein